MACDYKYQKMSSTLCKSRSLFILLSIFSCGYSKSCTKYAIYVGSKTPPDQANEKCLEKGKEGLAIFHSQADMNRVKDVYRKFVNEVDISSVIIGLKFSQSKNNYEWDDGTELSSKDKNHFPWEGVVAPSPRRSCVALKYKQSEDLFRMVRINCEEKGTHGRHNVMGVLCSESIPYCRLKVDREDNAPQVAFRKHEKPPTKHSIKLILGLGLATGVGAIMSIFLVLYYYQTRKKMMREI